MFNTRFAAKPAQDGIQAVKAPRRVSVKMIGTLAVAFLCALCSAHGVLADTGETFTPDSTAYAGTITNTGTFVTSMIAAYAPKAILISVALGGVGLLWGWARRAVGH